MTVVSAYEARRKFAELLETAFYQNAQIHIHRNKKPMARLVGEPFMQAIDQLIKADPGLADTLAIMLNDEVQTALQESAEDLAASRVRLLQAPDEV
ncbi:hypothetical protein ACFLYO_10470 [Chloroflexota bacterium]